MNHILEELEVFRNTLTILILLFREHEPEQRKHEVLAIARRDIKCDTTPARPASAFLGFVLAQQILELVHPLVECNGARDRLLVAREVV